MSSDFVVMAGLWALPCNCFLFFPNDIFKMESTWIYKVTDCTAVFSVNFFMPFLIFPHIIIPLQRDSALLD